ncbi:MAG: hypothetical protein ACRD0K_04545 [Egibacteraceae bacterium]
MADRKRKTIQLAVLACVLLAGIGLGVGASRLGGGSAGGVDTPATATASGVTSAGDPDALTELPGLGAPIAPDQTATPEQAVAGFLTAEATGDFAGSYAYLATADHQMLGTPASWVQSHADFPVVTGFKIEGAAPEVDGVRVTTLTGYRPGLDEILGLVTARARSSWLTVQENGVWRVVFTESTDRPLYPGDAAADEVARQWAARRISCEPTSELEASLKGSPFLAGSLCQAKGELRLGGASELSQLDDTTPFVSAYGPDVFTWARTVPITSPQPLQVILAPIGADWKVIGVIRANVLENPQP